MSDLLKVFFRSLALALALPCAVPGAAGAVDNAAPLVLEGSIPLPGVSGRIDHLAFDSTRKRLLVAEFGAGSVDVIDLAAGKTINRIEGLHRPQGIVYVPKADLIAVTSASDGSVQLFKADGFAPVGAIDLGQDADTIRVDPASGRLVIGFGAGELAVVDPVSKSVVSQIKLTAHPQGFQIDPKTHRVFVNLPDNRQTTVVDLVTDGRHAGWGTLDLAAAFPVAMNFPMAMDADTRVIAVASRSPAVFELLNMDDGAVNMRGETCGDANDISFDSKRERVYVSCGDGNVDIFGNDVNIYRFVGRIKTTAGARTSLFVPEVDRLFVAAKAGSAGHGSDAAILILRPSP